MDPEKKRQYQLEWRKKNPNYDKQWKSLNAASYKSKRLKWLYGISFEEYNKMFLAQDGKCAICEKHQSEQKRALSVDHNHSTKKVRQLLCDLCNRALGYFKDNPELLDKAANYLRKHNGLTKTIHHS